MVVHKKFFKCKYPGCSISPREKRQCLLHYVRVHLKGREAHYCDLCETPLLDETHITEHLGQMRHKRKAQKNPRKPVTIVNTGRPLKENEVLDEQIRNVNTTLKTAIEAMPEQDKEKLLRQLAQSRDIVKKACKEAFGEEVPRFEVEIREGTDDEDEGEISDESEGAVIIVESKEEEEKEKDDTITQAEEVNNESNEEI